MFPKIHPLIHSAKLQLRQTNPNDAKAVHTLRSNDQVNQFVRRKRCETIREAEAFIASRKADFEAHKSIYWAISLQETSYMLGSICLWNFSEDHQEAELGYDLHPDFQGKGLMSEALRKVLWYGLVEMRLASISAYTQFDNAPSIQLLESNGFFPFVGRKDDDNPKNRVFEIAKDAYFQQLTKPKSWVRFLELAMAIKSLPYGRNSSRSDLSMVLTEGKGTCSSKHAFLADIAKKNTLNQVQLVLGIYMMDNQNTPAIGLSLENSELTSIPEAHCYLRIDGKRHDFTHENADIAAIEPALVSELIILPEQVNTFKIQYHKSYIKSWMKQKELALDFEAIWNLREACIAKLVQAWGK